MQAAAFCAERLDVQPWEASDRTAGTIDEHELLALNTAFDGVFDLNNPTPGQPYKQQLAPLERIPAG